MLDVHTPTRAVATTVEPVEVTRRPRAVHVSASSIVMLTLTALMGVLAFCWPLVWRPGAELQGGATAPLVFALILPVVMGLAVVQLSGNELDVKALALLGVLSAVGAAIRPLGAGTAGLETVFFLLILAGRVFGPGFGFLLGTTTLFASALVTSGVGPWLPHQMLAAAFVGLGAGLLPRIRGWVEIAMLAVYGGVSAFAYGWAMDFAFWPFSLGGDAQLSFDPQASVGTNLHHFVLFNIATSMGWNAGRALSNIAFICILGPGLLRVLRRASRRANFE